MAAGRGDRVERIGKVIEKHGNRAVVLMRRHVACEGCGRCGGLLGGPDTKDSHVEVDNPIDALPGQTVRIEVDDGKLLLFSFVFYLLPVIVLLAGIWAGFSLAAAIGFKGDHVLIAVISGLGLAAMTFGGIRIWDRRVKDNPRYRPVITALVDEEKS